MITSPTVSTQMTFIWDHAEPVSPEVGHRAADTKLPVLVAPTENSWPIPIATHNASILCADAGTSNGKLDFMNQRICKPVRIGGVMFKLLKRYGISDQEIAQGLATYANGCA